MSKLLLDYNPLTGETVTFDYNDHLRQVVLTHSQDVQPALDMAAAMRADKQLTKDGIKKDWVHYALIPATVQVEMKQKHGVNFHSREDAGKVFKLINDEYSRFKTTEIMHSIKNG